MTPEALVILFGVPIGLLTSATSGLAALGVRRLIGQTDKLQVEVTSHGERLAAMEVKMPNGEWRSIRDGLAAVHVDVLGVRSELSAHILDESVTLAAMSRVLAKTSPRVRKRK